MDLPTSLCLARLLLSVLALAALLRTVEKHEAFKVLVGFFDVEGTMFLLIFW